MAATAGHYLITVGFPPLGRWLDRRRRDPPVLQLSYFGGRGVLRTVLASCTGRGWAVRRLEVDREALTADRARIAAVTLQLAGRGDLSALAAELTELDGVRAARTGTGPLDEE
ncbi:MAG TPA: hypothetical protein VNO83_18860 [Pseudonocardia sp.]|nr:hypothetical protein [Pseudonocardia sp.]